MNFRNFKIQAKQYAVIGISFLAFTYWLKITPNISLVLCMVTAVIYYFVQEEKFTPFRIKITPDWNNIIKEFKETKKSSELTSYSRLYLELEKGVKESTDAGKEVYDKKYRDLAEKIDQYKAINGIELTFISKKVIQVKTWTGGIAEEKLTSYFNFNERVFGNGPSSVSFSTGIDKKDGISLNIVINELSVLHTEIFICSIPRSLVYFFQGIDSYNYLEKQLKKLGWKRTGEAEDDYDSFYADVGWKNKHISLDFEEI